MRLSKFTPLRLAGAGTRSLYLDADSQFFGIVGQGAGQVALQVELGAGTGDLTTQIPLNSITGSIVVTQDAATNITTQILFSPNSDFTHISITRNRAALSLSITTNLSEPSIKDITSILSIIDSTDTQETTRTETEVV